MRFTRIFPIVAAALVAFGGQRIRASEANDWAIKVRLYRGDPTNEFKALNKLGVLIVNETSKGFVFKSSIFREKVHRGVTACLLIDSRVYSAEEERTRIINAINNIEVDGQFITFSIENPSSCLAVDPQIRSRNL